MFTYPMTLDSTGHLGSGLSDDFAVSDNSQTKATISTVMDSALTEPRQMKVSHTSSSRNGIAYARHLVRLDLQKTDVNDVDHSAAVYVVLDVPSLQSTITEADVLNLTGQLIDMLTNGTNVAELLAGQI